MNLKALIGLLSLITLQIFFSFSCCLGQNKNGSSNKKSSTRFSKNKRNSKGDNRAEFQFEFPQLNNIKYYYNPSDLALIEKFAHHKEYGKLLRVLEDYVSNFGIENFHQENDLLWKLAQLHEIQGNKEKAKSLYKLVLKHHKGKDLKNIQLHFDTLSDDEKHRYVPLEYYYELVEFRKAIDTLVPPKSVFLNMGELVNDIRYPDYGPTMNVQSNILIFTKRKKELTDTKLSYRENEELYYSKKYGDFWDEAQPFSRVINSHCNEGSATLSRDGKTLYFARCKVQGYQYDCMDCLGSCDIYVSHLQEDSIWSYPQNLGPEVNSTAWDSQPTLSHAEDTLFFASDRIGGFGLSDIYYCVKVGEKWSKPRNMGPIINTRGNEVSPFYHPVYHVLYFSSNGHLLNFGDFDSTKFVYTSSDIYKSRLLENKWQEPKNIGPLVNGKGNEFYFTIDYNSKDLFYAKADINSPTNLDLFSFPLPMEAQPNANTKLKGTLSDSLTGAPFKGIVSIIDLKNGIEVAPKYIREDGSYEFDLIDENEYLLVLQGDDFFRIEEKLYLKGDTSINLEAPSLKFKKWKFEHLEFEGGKAEILPDMEGDLNKVLDFMVDHPHFKLKISGHTDSDGNADSNLKLSQKRADAIKEYLVKKGQINAERIEANGYGNTKPIVEEKTDDDKKINRRVEFELINPDKHK